MQRTLLARRIATVTFGTTLSIAAVGGSAWASPGADNGHGTTSAPHQILTSPQPASNADFSGNGANVHGPYCSTRDGSASANGNGGGEATGKPCAGCVGKADNKNPRGQMPGPADHNAGYECDTNHGIAKGNPAHTRCLTPAPNCVPTATVPCVPNPPCVPADGPPCVPSSDCVPTATVPCVPSSNCVPTATVPCVPSSNCVPTATVPCVPSPPNACVVTPTESCGTQVEAPILGAPAAAGGPTATQAPSAGVLPETGAA